MRTKNLFLICFYRNQLEKIPTPTKGKLHELIINKNTRCPFFKIQGFFVHNNPEAKELRACDREKSIRVTPLDF